MSSLKDLADNVAEPKNPVYYDEWREIVHNNLPDLEDAIIACASAAIQLNVEDIVNPIALVLKDAPSSGKTVCLNSFRGFQEKVLYTDEFTENSMVSGMQAKKGNKAPSFAEQMQNKLVIISDLATVIHKAQDSVRALLGKLTRLLDGQGYVKQSGATGTVGKDQDLFFVMLMATTELTKDAQRSMSGLGPRMLFIDVGSIEPGEDEIFKLIGDPSAFQKRQAIVKERTGEFMRTLFQKDMSGMGIRYEKESIQMMVSRCATAMAYMRSDIVVEPDDFDRNEVAANAIQKEHPWRLGVTLHNMCRGQACLRLSEEIKEQDIVTIFRCLFSTGPKPRPQILRALAMGTGAMTDKELSDKVGMTRAQAKRELYVLALIGMGSITKSESTDSWAEFGSQRRNIEWIDDSVEYTFNLNQELQWLHMEEMQEFYKRHNII